MAEIIDKSYFTELKNAHPGTLCRKGRCSYHDEMQQYSLTVWGNPFLIDVGNSKIKQIVTTGPPYHEYFNLFVLYYLLSGNDVSQTGEWVSEKDFPGGSTFFRGPHQIPTELITRQFGNDLQKFKTRCAELAGTPITMADAAYSFSITPDISLAVLYWLGDEDFPAEAKILFDRSITGLLPLDILFALAVGVCARIGTELKQ